jgi:ABC-type multidrug transport system ATPase subunit
LYHPHNTLTYFDIHFNHSPVEEADILSDRIGIMSHGHLMCLGNAVHLKKKFGDGYRLSLSYGNIFQINFPDVEHEDKIFAFIKRLVPESRLINQFYGISVFNIPNENSKISFLFSEIEKNKTEQNIKNWGLSQTSLEDVFLEVIKNDESEE